MAVRTWSSRVALQRQDWSCLRAVPLAAQKLTGAGATFPYPIYSKWFDAYNKKTGVEINYQSIGSGGGHPAVHRGHRGLRRHRRPDERVPDHGSQRQRACTCPPSWAPWSLTYNLPSLGDTKLKLDGTALVDIFMGRITKWNDKRITTLNPGVNLPETDLIVVHRSDGSGTSYIFTDFLTKYLPGMEGQGRLRHVGQLADRAGRQGQRGRDPAGQAGRRRGRVRRADLRDLQQAARTPDQ